MSRAYYNEHDPKAAAWLRELIAAEVIAPGDVDERDIRDVLPSDLHGYTQCHLFAGIGVWSYAFRRAGWSDDRPVWSCSCPCQPFSAAGQGAGFADERHLWPAAFHLIEKRRAPVVFGEQVASKDADPWIDLVQADLEALGYAFGAVPFPAAGVGAPHIRDRLYWMADAAGQRLHGRRSSETRDGRRSVESERLRIIGGLDHADDARLEGLGRGHQAEGRRIATLGPVAETGESSGLADTDRQHADHGRCGAGNASGEQYRQTELSGSESRIHRPGPTNGYWRAADWLLCRDGRWRPVEPGTSPLAHGAPARVGRLRGYGNAINAEAARAFIESYLEVTA